MRNFINFVIAMMLMVVSNSAMAGNPNVSIVGTSISIEGVEYDVSGYFGQAGAYKAVKHAEYVHVIKLPEDSSSANGGDWCEFIQFENGEIALSYANHYWVFSSNHVEKARLFEETTMDFVYPEEGFSFCGENPYAKGAKVGYFYARKDNCTYAVVFCMK